MTAQAAARFGFVQFDIAGRLGLDDGRYLVRSEEADQATVVVVQTLGAGAAVRRPGSRRRRRSRRADPGEPPADIPVTRLTVVPGRASDGDAAVRELKRVAGSPEVADSAIAAALRTVNTVLRAQRMATHDPYGREIGRQSALVVRTGYGTGDGLAEGRWEEAVEVPPSARREHRAQALRPQERLAGVLAGREPIDVCEPLILRARADLDQGRTREAALQLRIGLEALLAELPGSAGPDQEEDLAALEGRRGDTVAAAEEALRNQLPAERAQELSETLGICERVLRRRQILR